MNLYSKFISKKDSKNDPKNIVVGRARVEPTSSDAAPAAVIVASEKKSDGESMINEGGHATPGKTPSAIRDTQASTAADRPTNTASVDGKDESELSAKSAD